MSMRAAMSAAAAAAARAASASTAASTAACGRSSWRLCGAAFASSSSSSAVASPAWTATAGVSCRTYFAVPEPSWTKDDVLTFINAKARKGRNRPGLRLGRQLNDAERVEFGKAKKYGFVRFNNLCKEPLCNQYLHWCYENRRPYMALNKHGDRLVVDLKPAGGLPGAEDASRVDAVENSWGELIQDHFLKGIQIVNTDGPADLEDRRMAAVQDGVDGSNEGKVADNDISTSFHLFTRKRQDSLKLATDLWAAFVAISPEHKLPKEIMEDAAAKKERRRIRWERQARQKLRALIADPKAYQKLPKGCLDGFQYWDERKQAHLDVFPAKWMNKPC